MAAKSVDTLREDVRNGKFKMTKSDTVLFGFNRKTLSDEAKAQLDSFVQSLDGLNHYVVAGDQGFRIRPAPRVYNDELSQERAQAVARYLASHNVPLRNITMLGTGVADGEQKNPGRTGARPQGRRPDFRSGDLRDRAPRDTVPPWRPHELAAKGLRPDSHLNRRLTKVLRGDLHSPPG